MDNLKKLNLKKQLLSLKYCLEDLIIENKALSSHSHLLENLFKQTKNYTKKSNITNSFDFNFKNDKKYQTISNKKNYLYKNIDKQNNTLRKSILFNKYTELIKEKEFLIQTLEEKKNNLKSIQQELNIYKINNVYNAYNKYKKLNAKIYLNEILDVSNINKKTNEKNNNNVSLLINTNFKKAIKKEKIGLEKNIENSKDELKKLYDYSVYNFRKKMKELGFNSILKNKKNKKTYIISVQPNQFINNNSSDSDSENNTDINKSNSINERLFINDFQISFKKYNETNFGNKIKLKKTRNRLTDNTMFNKNLDSFYIKNNNANINTGNTEFDVNISSQNFRKKNNNILTEVNDERTFELNNKLLKIKEIYYNCLDKRYQLKSLLKGNISNIYKTKERIKKIKKQKHLKY